MTALLHTLGAGSTHPQAFVDVVVILVVAGVAALLMQRLRLAVIPAYLITGAMIGPGGLALVSDAESVQLVGDVALVLLMFGIGLHLDTSALGPGVRRLIFISVGATLATVGVLWPLARFIVPTTPQALAVAMAFAMSSTAVVLRIIQQRHELHHVDGRLALSILIIQDLAAIVALMILPPLAEWAGTAAGAAAPTGMSHRGASVALDFVAKGALALAAILGIVLIGRFVLPWLLSEAARQKSTETMTVVSTAAALGTAALTAMVGLTPALGAFLGGFMLSSSQYRHQMHGQIGTLRDVFAAVFFTAMGMSLNLAVVWVSLPTILIAAAVLLVAKALVIALACWLGGKTVNVSLKVGLMLFQAGEFTVVMLKVAEHESLGLIPPSAMNVLVAVVVVSLIATPSVIRLAAAVARRVPDIGVAMWVHPPPSTIAEPIPDDAGGPAKMRRRVIVAGFGLVGRVVADGLSADGAEVTIIELNPGTVQRQTSLGRRVVFGDVANAEVLESAGIREAHALILTVPDEEAVLSACHAARQANPTIFIIARTNYVSKGMVATGLGANDVVIEELATAEAMERVVMKSLADVGGTAWVSKV